MGSESPKQEGGGRKECELDEKPSLPVTFVPEECPAGSELWVFSEEQAGPALPSAEP